MSQTAANLVDHVIPQVPVRQWVLSLPIPLRLLLAVRPELVTPVLGVVQRVLERRLLDAAGLVGGEGRGGAVTLIQRFGSAANLNIHLHCLVLDGVYRSHADGVPEFIEVAAPTEEGLHDLLQTVIARLMKLLTRPALSEERIQVNAAGQVQLELKTPWRDGTTHLVLSPLAFLQRLAALVPRPRLHLIRYHGVLAPNARLRARVVPQGPPAQAHVATGAAAPAECEQAKPVRARAQHIGWARLLKRVFDIDLRRCPSCGAGELKIIAAILERPVIEKILTHLGLDPQPPPRGRAREIGQH
jgi:hypothetical protein